MENAFFVDGQDPFRYCKYCRIPNDHQFFPLYWFVSESTSIYRPNKIEELAVIVYQHFVPRISPDRPAARIADIVDIIRMQAGDIVDNAQVCMYPFLPEYNFYGAAFTPPLTHSFFDNEETLQTELTRLAKSEDFHQRFLGMMRERAKTTCYECCLYLTLLAIKCSFIRYQREIFILSTDPDVESYSHFNLYVTQILLGCYPGVDREEHRHNFIHKHYKMMLITPQFSQKLARYMEDIQVEVYMTVDKKYYESFSVVYWKNVPCYENNSKPTVAVIEHMIQRKIWQEKDICNVHKLAVYLIFHLSLYRDCVIENSFVSYWHGTNRSHKKFMVICERHTMRPIYVRFTQKMLSSLNTFLGNKRLNHRKRAVRQ